jgi:hypothetical protein
MNGVYGIARCHVGRSRRRQRRWLAYHAAPGVAASWVFLGSCLGVVGLVVLIEISRLLCLSVR